MAKKESKPKTCDWKDYDEETVLLYSYLKKKGKHQRAEKDKKSK
tara:strand:+ start:1146 stop:1277 length:132 start_codon:yes stop_codon:yes gene_type:complete